MEKYHRKPGENEAMQILQRKGILFDEEHHDFGYDKSKPDLKYSDGRYLEVTHTIHNNAVVSPQILTRYLKMDIENKLEIEKSISEALDRIRNYPDAYQRADGHTLKEDKELIENHYGKYDPLTGTYSEFECDLPIIDGSSDNILYRVKEKWKKHSNGNVDLFVFVLEGEYESMRYLMESSRYNGNSELFRTVIMESPFPTVYVCVWDFERQEYIIDDPTMIKFWKEDELLKYQIWEHM